MLLSNTIFICATLIAATVAQSPSPTTTSLHFTSTPTNLVAGVKQTIGWAGGNGNAVNIILQQGPASNLTDVPIPPIASGVEGTSTTWIPSKSLPDAGNYALRIEQGDSVNYSGMLQLFGGCSTCPTDAALALAPTSTSKPSTGSTTAPSHSSTASSSSKSGVVSPSESKSGSNSTGAAGAPSNATIAGSSMNSSSMANMTMSGTNSTTNSTANSNLTSAKLHATSSKSSSSASSTSSSTSSSSSSSSSESTSSSTGSSTSPSATQKSGGATVAASNFALFLCAVVGVVYLG